MRTLLGHIGGLALLPQPTFKKPPEGAPKQAGKRGGEIVQFKPIPENGDIDEELTRQLIHGYYASTSYVDAQIGRLIDGLDGLGLSAPPISPPSSLRRGYDRQAGPTQWLFQGPPAESKLLAVREGGACSLRDLYRTYGVCDWEVEQAEG